MVTNSGVMKHSVALHFLLLVVVVSGLSNDTEENVSENDTTAPRLAMMDDNGNLVDMDLDAANTEDIEAIREDLPNTVLFYLHTVNNPALSDAQQLWVDDVETLSKSYFDSSKRTRFVTHGWLNSAKSNSCVLIREAYLKHGEYNVIVVDWNKISAGPYSIASSSVKIVGEYIGKMIDFLATQGADTTEMIVVGHSLGGHIAGLAALQANSTVGYVVSLDPALPLFYTASSNERVAKGDANFVQVIHTNAGALGYVNPIGNVDFYPNGGSTQAGCNDLLSIICSHSRAYIFFAESINSNTGFVGTKCDNYSDYTQGSCQSNDKDIMGGPEPTTTATGSYYLDTNALPPYAKGS